MAISTMSIPNGGILQNEETVPPGMPRPSPHWGNPHTPDSLPSEQPSYDTSSAVVFLLVRK